MLIDMWQVWRSPWLALFLQKAVDEAGRILMAFGGVLVLCGIVGDERRTASARVIAVKHHLLAHPQFRVRHGAADDAGMEGRLQVRGARRTR